jgi:hypothetical protein
MQSNCVLRASLAQLAVFAWTFIDVAIMASLVCVMVLA